MGQYYKPVIIDSDNNLVSFNSWSFDNGAKLTEHSYFNNTLVDAVAAVIREVGPVKLWWLGDYADEVEECPKFFNSVWRINEEDEVSPVCEASKLRDEFIEQVKNAKDRYHISFISNGFKGYLVNHTTKEYIDLGAYFCNCAYRWSNDDFRPWCLSPMALLTAVGNGCGGGDYRGINSDLVGSWAGNLISITDDKPDSDYSNATLEYLFYEKTPMHSETNVLYGKVEALYACKAEFPEEVRKEVEELYGRVNRLYSDAFKGVSDN